VRVELELPVKVDAPALARSEVDRIVGLTPEAAVALKLALNELVTNSIRHGGLGDEQSIQVVIELSPDRIRAEVVDYGRGFASGPWSDEGGRGFVLVQSLTSRFGLIRDGSTRSWFEIDLPSRE
jgi:two-component sensor histidine kinase